MDLDIGWRFPVPDYGAGRMGRDGTLYEMGQWYPRVAVYDDVRGWNHEPYIGGGEFYLEYGRFDVALTVPGELRRRRHRHAAQSGRGPDAPRSGRGWPARGARRRRWPSSPPTRPATRRAPGRRGRGPLTWRFTADSVRDFAFGAAPDFRWDASAYRRHAGPYPVPAVGTRVGGGQPDGARRGPVLQRAVVPAIPMPTSPASKGRSRGWSIP